jgi:hypothetical protein
MVKDKMKATNLKKYGVKHAASSPEVKERIRISNLKTEEENKKICEKRKATNLKNRGYEHHCKSPEIKEKMKANNLEKYGVVSTAQIKYVKDKMKATNVERYGYENPMQNPEILNKQLKSAYKTKEYEFPSGRIDMVQGYEPWALDYLLNVEFINEDDIITSKSMVPEIWWYDENGKKHRYYVDIFIPGEERCIEVKSDWTFEDMKDIVLIKQQAVKDAGYKCEIWVYNKKGEREQVYN